MTHIENMPTMWVSRVDPEGFDYPEHVADVDALGLSDDDRIVIDELLAKGVDAGECNRCGDGIGWLLHEYEDGGGSVVWVALVIVGDEPLCEDCGELAGAL